MIVYGFDDYRVGKMDSNRMGLVTKELRRPKELNLQEWYTLASKVCTLLNKHLTER